MLPFRVTTVVTCDDVRLEQNNKFILIGVYNGVIVCPGFPTEITLSWWIQLRTEKTGKHDLEIRLLKDKNATLLRAILGFEIHAVGWSNIALPQSRIQLQGPGHLELQIRPTDENIWETIAELDVIEGTVANPLPIQRAVAR